MLINKFLLFGYSSRIKESSYLFLNKRKKDYIDCVVMEYNKVYIYIEN